MTEDQDITEEFELLTDYQRGIVAYAAENPRATSKEIAESVGCSPGYANKIRNQKDHLIRHRRTMDTVGPSPEAVRMAGDTPSAAQEDEKLDKGVEKILTDGADEEFVSVDLRLTEVFRCIRLLPNDLAAQFFTQIRGGVDPAEMFQEEEE